MQLGQMSAVTTLSQRRFGQVTAWQTEMSTRPVAQLIPPMRTVPRQSALLQASAGRSWQV